MSDGAIALRGVSVGKGNRSVQELSAFRLSAY